ncbi:MAG: hypothetical protein FWD53_08575, partial [Phycisphaerales bacterium]|nr:hypothetical protein [Phycisphaerales bacterium]
SGILSPNGKGRPADSPLAENNSTHIGKPKKAKAKLLADERGIGAYLVLNQEVTTEDRTLAAETFGLPDELVITQKEYEKRTGKPVNFLPPLPTLALAESLEALEYARTLIANIEKEAESELEQIKADAKLKTPTPGRRGKYITDRVTAEVYIRITATHVQKIRPSKINDEEWTTRMQTTLTDLTPKAQSLHWPDHAIPLYAAAVLTRQYTKRDAAASSQITSDTQNHP